MRALAIASILLCLLTLIVAVSPAQAATINVTTFTDGINITGCSLREAILTANSNFPLPFGCGTGGGADVIQLALPGTYTLSGTQLPTVTSSITIQPVIGSVTIRAAATENTADHLIFEVGANGDLTLDNVTVRFGGSTSFTGGAGCILVSDGTARLTVLNSVVEGCHTASFPAGGGISSYGEGNMIAINNSIIRNNSAACCGGGINSFQGTLSLDGTSIIDNQSTNSDGGGIMFVGIVGSGGYPLTIANSIFQGNTASVSGGGIKAATGSSVHIDNTTFSDNSAEFNGGAIDWEGHGVGATLIINGSVLVGNTAAQLDGGAIYVGGGFAIISSSRLESNSSHGLGSAFYSESGKISLIEDSCIVGNNGTALYAATSSSMTHANGSWWGTSWGPRIASAGGGSAVSNGDAIGGSMDITVFTPGTESGTPIPYGNWLTSPPTVAGALCKTCSGVSSISQVRICA